ncbi:MAG: type II toxin-antitoxin system PemK/MazF family toxin [Actinomycetota bacterium]|nr:type II toxin-antitoxin system PemK/MazF family toxin [Actinomycetota bacterium]
MTEARQGDVWLVDFGVPVGREQGYRRPSVVVSSDMLNSGPGGVVVVVPVTTAHRGLPSHVEVEAYISGLDEVSYAKCEDVKSISVERLERRFGAVPPEVLARIRQILRYLFEL